jgi:hypothetical protein
MRKFIVEHSKRGTSIIEVDVVLLSLLEDTSLAWRLKSGESIYRVLAPANHDMVMSWAVFDTEEHALGVAVIDITMSYKRQAEKAHTAFDEAACNEELMSIKTCKLGAENEKRKQQSQISR